MVKDEVVGSKEEIRPTTVLDSPTRPDNLTVAITDPQKETAERNEPELPLTESASAYLLQEAKLMNERVKWYLEQQEKLETQGLFASGAIWAFVLSRPFTPTLEYVTWLPFVLTLVLFVKSLLFTEALKESFAYIEKLEALCEVPANMGWARTFRLYGKKLKRRWRKAFWVGLVIGNLIAAVVIAVRHLLVSPP